MRTLRARFRWLPVALAITLASVGCSGKKDDETKDKEEQKPEAAKPAGEVSGTVTLPDGNPLPLGWIGFHGKDASETALATVTDGKFLAKGVPVGDSIRVTVDVGAAAKEVADLGEQIQEALTRAPLLKQSGLPDAHQEKHFQSLKERHAQLVKVVKAIKGLQVPPPGMPMTFFKPPYPKYLLPETSPLRFNIVKGAQTITIKIEP